MRVFTIFSLVFCLGLMTFHFSEGMKRATTLAKQAAGTLKRSGSSKNVSSTDEFLGIVNALPGGKQYQRLASNTGSPPRYKQTKGSPMITPAGDQQLTPEQTCAQQLSKALEDMKLGNLIKETLNKEMALELENQLINHFEVGAKADDFLMNYGEFVKAQADLPKKDPVPVKARPEIFNLGEEDMSGETPETDMQRRCSKRCFWLYGYYMTRVVLEETQTHENDKKKKEKHKVNATLVDERIIAPIAQGKYFVDNKTKAHMCDCKTMNTFKEQAKNYNINYKRFNKWKKVSSETAMTYMQEQIEGKDKEIELLDHETFLELVLFEILKHVREGKQHPEVVMEVRTGVLAGEEDYKQMMRRGTRQVLEPSPSFLQRLKSTNSWSLRGFLSRNRSKLGIAQSGSPDRKKF